MVNSHLLCFSALLVGMWCIPESRATVVKPRVIGNETFPQAPITLAEIEKRIGKLAETVTKTLLPYFVKNSDVNLTGSCLTTLIRLFVDIRKLKLPAIKLLDAIAKPPFGMLGGAFAVMGEYDECLDVSVNRKGDVAKNAKDEQFHGQYCTIEINLPQTLIDGMKDFGLGKKNLSDFGKLGPFVELIPAIAFSETLFRFRAGVCLPSTCTIGDLQEIINLVLNFASINFLPIKVNRCESGSTVISKDQLTIIYIFGIVSILVILGTVLDAVSSVGCSQATKTRAGKVLNFFRAFSIYSNTVKLLHRKKDTSHEVTCINGMYVLGTLLVVIYHTYFLPFFVLFSRSASNLGHYMKDAEFTLISTMGISIEAYFLFSGLFLVYGRFKRGSTPQINVIQLLVRRYIRLCPSLMLIVGIIIVMPLIGSGPVWTDIVVTASDNGRKWWYSYIGMYNNFLQVKDQTYLYLWFIPCLMQITILGAILTWILSKNRKLGIGLIVLTAVSCNITLGIITAIYNYPPSYAIYFYYDREHFEIPIYTAPLSHVTSFCVGMLLGYYMSQRKSLKWSKLHVCIGWLLSILLTVGIQYVLYPYHDGQQVNLLFSSVYAATHKTLFSMGIAWIILACNYGYGGIMGKILSWKGFVPLSKLGYFAYLLHYLVIVLHVSQSRIPITFSHAENWIRICSYTTLTFIAAYVFYIAFELPLTYIESLFFLQRNHSNGKEEVGNDAQNNFKNLDIVAFGNPKAFKLKKHGGNAVVPMPLTVVFTDEHSHL